MSKIERFIKHCCWKIGIKLVNFAGGVPVSLRSKTWKTDKGTWSWSFLWYKIFEDKLIIDFDKRSIEKIKR